MRKWIWRTVKGGLLLALILILGLTIALITRPWWRREWAPRHCETNLVSHWPLLKLADVKRDSAFDLLQRAAAEQRKISSSAAAKVEHHVHDVDSQINERNRVNLVPWSAAAFPNLTRNLAEGAGALASARSAASAPTRRCQLIRRQQIASITQSECCVLTNRSALPPLAVFPREILLEHTQSWKQPSLLRGSCHAAVRLFTRWWILRAICRCAVRCA